MHHVELPNLREEAPHRLITVLSEADGAGPVREKTTFRHQMCLSELKTTLLHTQQGVYNEN
jgi:hypothetical protein